MVPPRRYSGSRPGPAATWSQRTARMPRVCCACSAPVHISDVLGCAITLADIRIAQGRLHDARRTYEQALQLATEHSPSVLRGTADMHVGLSQLDRERNDLEAATRHLLRVQELGEHNGLPKNPYRARVAHGPHP